MPSWPTSLAAASSTAAQGFLLATSNVDHNGTQMRRLAPPAAAVSSPSSAHRFLTHKRHFQSRAELPDSPCICIFPRLQINSSRDYLTSTLKNSLIFKPHKADFWPKLRPSTPRTFTTTLQARPGQMPLATINSTRPPIWGVNQNHNNYRYFIPVPYKCSHRQLQWFHFITLILFNRCQYC